jgi:hypothetical protein
LAGRPRDSSRSGDACVAVGAADMNPGFSMLRINATQASPLQHLMQNKKPRDESRGFLSVQIDSLDYARLR